MNKIIRPLVRPFRISPWGRLKVLGRVLGESGYPGTYLCTVNNEINPPSSTEQNEIFWGGGFISCENYNI